MHCLDTDIVIAVFRGKDATLRAKLEKLQKAGAEFAITTLTLCELYRGTFLSSMQEKSIGQINSLLGIVDLLEQDKLSCLIFGRDAAFLEKKGMKTQEVDLMIASICKSNNCMLVTRNISDFGRIPDLMVEVW